MINRIDGNGEPSLKQITEVKKLKEDIVQYILQHKKEYINETKFENYTKTSDAKKITSHSVISKNLEGRKTNTTKTEFKIHKFINCSIAQRQKEIEDEIEEYLKLTKASYDNY